MAAFSTDQSEWDRLDFSLLQNSPVALYFRQEVLDEDTASLRREGYQIEKFDCTGWHAESNFHTDISARLAFPDYYGRNLDAFNECIGDIEVPDAGGRAIVFCRYDMFVRSEPRVAQLILDIMACASRHHLLFGRRLLTMVQSNDPRIDFQPVGARPVSWNPREWLNKNRGL